eukprot:m.669518 g.669518  ORF g.669518 m.669518 type:complete len:1099 (-) comp22763_c0_seq6:148-3444(-)
MSHGSATMEEYLDGLPPFLLKTAKPLASKCDWVPGVHVIRGGLDFTTGKLPHYKDLEYEFVPFSETGNSRFDDDKTTYLASSDGTVTVWARPTEDSRTKRKVQTLTLDGWEFHHVLLLRLQNTIAKHSTRMIVVSPTRSQQIPALSHNLKIGAQLNGVNHALITGSANDESHAELLRLRAENSALRNDKQNLQEQLTQALLESKELQKSTASMQARVAEVEEERRRSEEILRMQIGALEEAKQALLTRIEGMSERLEMQETEAADNSTHLTVKDASACKTRSLSMQDFMTQEQMLGEAETTMAKVQTIGSPETDPAELVAVRTQLEEKSATCAELHTQLAAVREQLEKAVRENQDAHTGMEVLQEQLAQSKATIAEFELDHADVAHKLSEEESKAAALQQEHEQTQTGIEVLQEQLAESKASIAGFEMEHATRIAELTAEVEERTRQQKVLEEQLASVAKTDGSGSAITPDQLRELEQLRSDKDAATKDLAALTQSKDELQQKLNDAQLGMDLMQEELAQSKATISEFEMQHETNIAKLSAEVDEQTRTSSATQDELLSTKAKLDEAVRKLSGTPSTGDDSPAVQALHDEIASQTAAVVNANEQISTLTSELESKSETVTALEAKVADLSSAVTLHTDTTQSLEAKVAELGAENTRLEAVIAELEEKIQTTDGSSAEQLAALAAAEALTAQLRAQLDGQAEEVATLQANEKQAMSTVSEVEGALETLHAKISVLDVENATHKASVDEKTAQLEEKTAALDKLEAEIAVLKASGSEQETLSADLAAAVAAKDTLATEKEALEAQLATNEEALEANTAQIEKLEQENAASAETMKTLEEQVDVLQKELTSLQALNAEHLATITQLQEEAKALTSQDASATEELQKKVDEQSAELDSSAAQISKLMEKSIALSNSILELTADKETVELERDDLSTQVADLTEQVATLHSKLETAQTQAASASTELPATLDDASLETAMHALQAKVALIETASASIPEPLSDEQADKAIDAHLAKGIADLLQRISNCENAVASTGGIIAINDSEPVDTAEESVDVGEESVDVGEEPVDMDEEPVDMDEEPVDMDEEPVDVDAPEDEGEEDFF